MLLCLTSGAYDVAFITLAGTAVQPTNACQAEALTRIIHMAACFWCCEHEPPSFVRARSMPASQFEVSLLTAF
jgi:hypothetical protein